MWRRYKLRINASEEQGLRGHRHVDDVTSPCERSKTEQTSEMVIQGAIDACEPLQTRGKDMVMEPAGYEKQ